MARQLWSRALVRSQELPSAPGPWSKRRRTLARPRGRRRVDRVHRASAHSELRPSGREPGVAAPRTPRCPRVARRPRSRTCRPRWCRPRSITSTSGCHKNGTQLMAAQTRIGVEGQHRGAQLRPVCQRLSKSQERERYGVCRVLVEGLAMLPRDLAASSVTSEESSSSS